MTDTSREPFHPNVWERKGRGRELQFYALDSELDAWLERSLPALYGPYWILGFDAVKTPTASAWSPFTFNQLSLAACRRDHQDRTQFWLVASRLSGTPPGCFASEGECSLSGLILLQHGSTRRGLRQASRIAIVDRVLHKCSGEVVVHDMYRKIFSSLVSGARRMLRYSTTLEGSSIVDDKSVLMTAAAASAARRGEVAFDRTVGAAVGEIQE